MAIGEIARVHGLRGEVRVTPLTDHPERFERVTECVLWDATRDERETRRITTARRHGDTLLVTFAGCASPEDARTLVGRLIALPRADALPPPDGSFYPWQLEGARVTTEDGRLVGRVTGIERGGAQDLWVVTGDGREHLIPAVPDIVLDVDIAAGRVVIRPPDGLLDL
ncbi:MAG TPA: ribosome maturation factor RimM [Candidatus Acidoferrum sp.]|nr:ribosome maturation factor RimM [Candidatus Acidoferrum sp.]